jgi:hypothetical protein
MTLVAYAELTERGDAFPLRCVMAMPFKDGLTSMVWDGIQPYEKRHDGVVYEPWN